jgi:DNA repair exonuclease SbcCD ATPase subunit
VQIQERLNGLKLHCNNLINNQAKYKERQDELAKFIEKNSIDVNSQPQTIDYGELQNEADTEIKKVREKIQALAKERSDTKDRIEKLIQQQQELILLQEAREKYQEELKTYEYRYNIINQTIDSLKKAKENLSLRYLDPIKKGFEKYSSLLTKSGLEDVVINSDFEVTPIELGQQRKVTSFSKGYRSIIDICLRFSLIDALFDKEKPMVILDDPFVNFDDDKLIFAKELLSSISEEIQIIYFVCHESRIILEEC